MSKKQLFYLLFPLLGILGFYLRAIQLRRGFAADTGLPLPGSGFASAALALLILALALLYTLRSPVAPAGANVPIPRGASAAAAHLAAAGLTALMGGLLLLRAPTQVEFLLGLCALLTALFFLLPLYRGLSTQMRVFCRMEHTLFYIAWLAVYFSRHISDPVVMAFWPLLAALCATVFSFYFLASAACGLPKPRRSLFCLCASSALLLLAAADVCSPSGAPYFCGLLAAALLQLFYGFQTLRN